MKTLIAYYSRHQENTRKLLDAIAAEGDVTLYDIMSGAPIDLNEYDRIGLASGIFYGGFARPLLRFAEERLPENKELFFLNTCGSPHGDYFEPVRVIAEEKDCRELGAYGCLSYDAYGPFKLVGGISKGHPTQEEIDRAVSFYRSL